MDGICLWCGEVGNWCRCDEPEESQETKMTNDNIPFSQMRSRFMFDEKGNDITTKALEVLGELCDWFEQNHPDCSSKPNLRVGREVLCVCVGDEALWNSSDNYLEELTCDWMLKAYEKDLRERLEVVEKWKTTKEQ